MTDNQTEAGGNQTQKATNQTEAGGNQTQKNNQTEAGGNQTEKQPIRLKQEVIRLKKQPIRLKEEVIRLKKSPLEQIGETISGILEELTNRSRLFIHFSFFWDQ